MKVSIIFSLLNILELVEVKTDSTSVDMHQNDASSTSDVSASDADHAFNYNEEMRDDSPMSEIEDECFLIKARESSMQQKKHI